jgi:hypothetical protein
MAIKLVDEYVNTTAADADYPGGSFKNATTGAGVDGTPLEKKWANDWLGFFQKLLAESETIPSGAPDTAVSSQYYDALMELVGELVTTHNTVTNPHSSTSAATASRLMLRDADGRSDAVAAISGNQVVNFSQFLSVLAANGYQKFPSGLIIQWGTVYVPNIDNYNISWPIPFPNVCLMAFGAGAVNDAIVSYLGGTTLTVNGATGNMYGQGAYDVKFIAIGY